MSTEETIVRRRLARILNGSTAVECVAGSVDLLTPSEIIEVKQVKWWKVGLGNLIVYAVYFPQRRKRLHLCGVTHEEYGRIIEHHCQSNGIRLTWEYAWANQGVLI